MTTRDPREPFDADAPLPVGSETSDPNAYADMDREHKALLAERDELREQVRGVEHTRTRATFFGLVIGAIILILLLVFILQNTASQRITLIFWDVNLPLGVSLLIAAIAGALLVALAGGLRMLQLNRALKRAKK